MLLFTEQRTKTVGVNFRGNVFRRTPRGDFCRYLSWHSATSADGVTLFWHAVWRQRPHTQERHIFPNRWVNICQVFSDFQIHNQRFFTESLPPAGINRALVGSNVAIVLFPTSHYSQAEPPLWLNGFPPPSMLSVPPEALPLFAHMQNRESLELIACSSSQKLRACELMSRRLVGCNYLEVPTMAHRGCCELQPGAGMWPFDMWPLEEIKQDGMSLDKLPYSRFWQRLHWLQQLVVEIHTMGRQI